MIHLCDQCADSVRPHGQRFFVSTLPIGGICSWCNRVGHHLYEDGVAEPVQAGFGPHPTSRGEIERHPSVIWDVNRYYADLGVSPKATRAEIRRAYVERGGHEDPHLTFVVKQLLNDKVRAAYDATPLGQIFFDAQRKAWVVEQRRKREGNLPGDEPDDLAEALDALVNQIVTAEQLDDDQSVTVEVEWPWSMWRWRAFGNYQSQAAAWVTSLTVALRERGLQGRFGIGFWHGEGVQVRRATSDFPVFFVGEGVTPDQYPELAGEAAELLCHRGVVLC